MNAAAFVIFLPSPVHIDYVASARAAIGVVLATVYCVPLFRERIHPAYPVVVSVTWSMIWFFAACLVFEVAGYNRITRSGE